MRHEDWALTGKLRCRRQGDVLVLQVQERKLSVYWGGGSVEADWEYRWRDAQTDDLQFTVEGLNVV